MRSGSVTQQLAVVIGELDRAAAPGDLHLDQADEIFEHRLEGGVDGDVLEDARLAVAQDVGPPAVGDVARDADQADDLVLVVAQRDLRGEDPGLLVVVVDDVLFLVDHRPPGLDDPLLVGEEAGGELRIGQFPVRLADEFFHRPAHALRRRAVGDDKTALDILDPQIVRHPVDQGLQRDTLVGDHAAGFGDVLVVRNPAAVRQGVMADLDAAPIRQHRRPDLGRHARDNGLVLGEVFFGVRGRGPGRHAQIDNLAQRRARAHVLGLQAIDLGVAGIAQDQPVIPAEDAHAFRDVLDGQGVALDLVLQCRDGRVALADDGRLCLRGVPRQGDDARLIECRVDLLPTAIFFRPVVHSPPSSMVPKQPISLKCYR